MVRTHIWVGKGTSSGGEGRQLARKINKKKAIWFNFLEIILDFAFLLLLFLENIESKYLQKTKLQVLKRTISLKIWQSTKLTLLSPTKISINMRPNSLMAFFFCSLFILSAAFFYYPKWQQRDTEATLSWDVSGYYMYLPAIFIYKDLKKLEFRDSIIQKYRPSPEFGQAFQHPSGNFVMKYSCGQALQYLPWFTIGHLLAKPLGYAPDGFSKPYQVAIGWGSLLVALLGLWFLRKNLLVYFSEKTTAITLLLLIFGSNYLNYSAFDGAMTHNWLFTLYCLMIYSTIRFYQKPSYSWAICIGILVGWAALTRPTEIVAALIPALWGIGSFQSLKKRFLLLKNHFLKYLLAAILCALVGSIQLFYWKYVSGDWVVYSYQDQGFSWKHPHIMECLFSARAGWLTYSPMMVFSLLGFWALYKQKKTVFVATLLFSLIFMYITFAWDIWWYGGSLGQRAMVQSYPILAFPLAAFAQSITGITGRNWLRWAFPALAAVLIYFNLWITHQAHKGGLYVSEQMTKYYFLKILGKYEIEPDAVKLLDTKEEFLGERKNIQVLKTVDFKADTVSNCFILDKNHAFSPDFIFSEKINNATWVRCSATLKCEQKEWDVWKMTQFIVRFTEGDKTIKERSIRIHRLVNDGETKTIFFDTKIPEKHFDTVKVIFWNANGEKVVRINDVRLEAYK
jgi:hypothetical protein